MKKVILRTPMRTKSNSFSDALFVRNFSDALSDPGPWHRGGLFSKLTTQPTKPSKPIENK
jgi:hypothetical protein